MFARRIVERKKPQVGDFPLLLTYRLPKAECREPHELCQCPLWDNGTPEIPQSVVRPTRQHDDIAEEQHIGLNPMLIHYIYSKGSTIDSLHGLLRHIPEC